MRDIDEDDPEFTWGQAQRILSQRKNTLKHLNFEFGDDYLSLRDDPLDQDDYLGTFHDFALLETLLVTTTSFSGQPEDEDMPRFPESVRELVDALPESLTLLGFCGRNKGWTGLEKLAQAVRDGYFPKLKKVLVQQDGEDLSRSQEALAAVGIPCEGYNFIYHSLGYYAADGWD